MADDITRDDDELNSTDDQGRVRRIPKNVPTLFRARMPLRPPDPRQVGDPAIRYPDLTDRYRWISELEETRKANEREIARLQERKDQEGNKGTRKRRRMARSYFDRKISQAEERISYIQGLVSTFEQEAEEIQRGLPQPIKPPDQFARIHGEMEARIARQNKLEPKERPTANRVAPPMSQGRPLGETLVPGNQGPVPRLFIHGRPPVANDASYEWANPNSPDYADESQLRAQFEASVDRFASQAKTAAAVTRLSPFRYKVDVRGRSHEVTLDPVFRAPVIQGKMLIPNQGNDHFSYAAQALVESESMKEALEAGLNVPRFSEISNRHIGGQLSRAHVTALRSLRQVGEGLRQYYGPEDRKPTYIFEENADLVALPSHLAGSDSTDFDEQWGRRGMMAFSAKEVFREWLGYHATNDGRIIMPDPAKGMARGKLRANANPSRTYTPMDVARKGEARRVGFSALRPASGQADLEIIADTLIAPHHIMPPGQIDIAEKMAENVMLSRSKQARQSLSWEDIGQIELNQADGLLQPSNFVHMYNRPGREGDVRRFGIEDMDARQVSLDAMMMDLPKTRQTALALMNQGRHFANEKGVPIHKLLTEMPANKGTTNYMNVLLSENQAELPPGLYDEAVNSANVLLEPLGYFIGGGAKKGREYMPELVAEYRSFNHIRHTDKFMGSALVKGEAAVKTKLATSNRQDLIDQADMLIGGTEPLKGYQAYLSGLANAASRDPRIRAYLADRHKLTPNAEGTYIHDESTHANWMGAVDELFVRGLESPHMRDMMKAWGILHEGVSFTRIASTSVAAPFLEGPNGEDPQIPGYTATLLGNNRWEITSPERDVFRLPVPVMATMSVSVSGKPGQMNIADLSAVHRGNPEVFERLFAQGEKFRGMSASVLRSALRQNPTVDEDVVRLQSAPAAEILAQNLQEESTGLRPDRADDKFYLAALKQRYERKDAEGVRNSVSAGTGQYPDFLLEKGDFSIRMIDPSTAYHLANFDMEGENNAAVVSAYVKTLRSMEANDPTMLASSAQRYQDEIETLARSRAIRKGLLSGRMEGTHTHGVLGTIELPENMFASGYVRPWGKLKAMITRWPFVTDESSAPLHAISFEEANKKYGTDLSTDPKFMRRNVLASSFAMAAQLWQMDYDGDTALASFLRNAKQIAVSPVSEITRRALISSNIPQEQVAELMQGHPEHAWQAMYRAGLGGGKGAIDSKLRDWASNYAGKASTLLGSVNKMFGKVTETTNVEAMSGAMNERWAKGMTGSVDTSVAGLLALVGATGNDADREGTRYLSRALGLNAKQPTIDLGSAMNLDELDEHFDFLRSSFWPDYFDLNYDRSTHHTNRIANFFEGARRAGMNLEDLEPLLRAEGQRDRNEAVYDFLKASSGVDNSPIDDEAFYQTLAGVTPTRLGGRMEGPQRYAAVKDTLISRYGEAMSLGRTKTLLEDSTPTKTTGWGTVPKWLARVAGRFSDPSGVRGFGNELPPPDVARELVHNYVAEVSSQNMRAVGDFFSIFGRKTFAGNRTPGEIEKSLSAYPQILSRSGGKDIFANIVGKYKDLWLNRKSVNVGGDTGLSFNEFTASLSARAGEVGAAWGQARQNLNLEGALSEMEKAEWLPATHVFSPSQLKGPGRFQDMVEGHALTWPERAFSFDEAGIERTGTGTVFHNMLQQVLIGSGVAKAENVERRMLSTKFGMVIQGTSDYADPETGEVRDLKFVSSKRFDQLTGAAEALNDPNADLNALRGGDLDELIAQVTAYVHGFAEMTGKDFTGGFLDIYDRGQVEQNVSSRLAALQGGPGARPSDMPMNLYLENAVKSGHFTPQLFSEALAESRSASIPVDLSNRLVQQNWLEKLGLAQQAAYVAERAGITDARGRRRSKPIMVNRAQLPDRPATEADLQNARKKQGILAKVFAKFAPPGMTYQERPYMAKNYQPPKSLNLRKSAGMASDNPFFNDDFFSMMDSAQAKAEQRAAVERQQQKMEDALAQPQAGEQPGEAGGVPPPNNLGNVLHPDPPAAPANGSPAAPGGPTGSSPVNNPTPATATSLPPVPQVNNAAPSPTVADADYDRWLNAARAGGVGISYTDSLRPGRMAEADISEGRPVIRLSPGLRGKNDHAQRLTRWHELGHAVEMMGNPYEDDTKGKDWLELLGWASGNLGGATLARDIERVREDPRFYGPGGLDPKVASEPQEMAADVLGLYMMDPKAFKEVAPHLVPIAQQTLSRIAPQLAQAAGVKVAGGQVERDPAKLNPQAQMGARMANRPGAGNGVYPGGAPGMGMPWGAAPGMYVDPMSGMGGPGSYVQHWQMQSMVAAANLARDIGATRSIRGQMTSDGLNLHFETPEPISGSQVNDLREKVKGLSDELDELVPRMGATWQQAREGVTDMGELRKSLTEWNRQLKDISEQLPKPGKYDASSLGRQGRDDFTSLTQETRDVRERLATFEAIYDRLKGKVGLAEWDEALVEMTGGDAQTSLGGGGGRRGRSGGRGGESGPPGIWGRFTDDLGGFAGMGWAGFAAFSLSRINNLMFGGIANDIETYRQGNMGMTGLHRTLYGPNGGVDPSLTERMMANSFTQNWVSYRAGERFSGLATTAQDTYNNMFSLDQQTNIRTAKEAGKGLLGAGAAAVVSMYMGRKVLGGMGGVGRLAAGVAGLSGFASGQEADSPLDAIVDGASNAAMLGLAAAQVSQMLGGPGQRAVSTLSPTVAKYMKGGALSRWWGGKLLGAEALGGRIAASGVMGSLGAAGAAAGVALPVLGGIGGLLAMGAGMEAMGAGIDDSKIDWDRYWKMREGGTYLSQRAARWVASGEAPGWVGNFLQWGDRNSFTPTVQQRAIAHGVIQAPDEDSGQLTYVSAGDAQRIARNAFRKGDISKLGIKDTEDLVKQLGLAGAGGDPEMVAQLASAFMGATGTDLAGLTSGSSDRAKLLFETITNAIREKMNPTQMMASQFGFAQAMGYTAYSDTGVQMASNFGQRSGIQQEQALMGAQLMSGYDVTNLGLNAAGREHFASSLGAMARYHSEGSIMRAQQLIQPSTPYTFNLGLQMETITPAGIWADYGIQNIAPTMDLQTGLAANQEELWNLDRKQMKMVDAHRVREYRIAWGTPAKMGGYYAGNTGGVYTPPVPAVMGEMQQRQQFNLDMLNKRHGHAMADMDWNIGLISSNLGRSMAMAGAQFAITQKGWEFQEQQFGFNRMNFNMNVRHGDERFAMQLGHIDRSLGMNLAERGLQRQIMMTQYRQQDEEMAIANQRRPVTWQWRFEDMAFQGEQAGLEFGWRQEDYRRNIRLATGRQKIGLRREMERDQIRYGMGEDQRERQEERLKQQKEWEDEDFERKKSHYEEIKGLQISLFDMQTAHMIEQANMQKESLALSQRQAKEGQVLQSIQMTAAEENFQTMKQLQTDLHGLQMQHMQEAAAEQIASIERNRTQAQEIKDATEAQMILEAEQDEAKAKRQEELSVAMAKTDEDRFDSIVAQAEAVAAMNLYFVAWRDEILPDMKQLAEDILHLIREAKKAGGGTPPPPTFPPTPGSLTPPTTIEDVIDAIKNNPANDPAIPESFGSNPISTARRSVEEVAEDLADLLLDTNSADRWLNGKYTRNGRR